MPRHVARCGPLDVGDTLAVIPTDRVPDSEIRAALAAATASPAYDGPPPLPAYCGPVAFGTTTVAKAQHREHERLDTALWFASLRRAVGLPVPALLDHGTTGAAEGSRWWLILQRIHGCPARQPTPAHQHALGTALRAWHEKAPPQGLALDDPGALGVFLGSVRKYHPLTYPPLAERLADLCRDLEMTAIHGDIAVGHNTLYQDGRLAAILDPGAIHIGPALFDLAWALAVDLPRGATPNPLLDAYGRDAISTDTLDALVPYFMLRRLLDCHLLAERDDARWLTTELQRRAPLLFRLPGVPTR